MAITFRHDAAAIIPSSNQSTRKYGQSLVLQQQQQKYAAQQAGYDRMFTALRDQNQNMVQQQRDWMQRDFALNRDRDQRDFVVNRDKMQFEQQQKLMEEQRQQQFMDEARNARKGMIMSDIQNGHYDAGTSQRLRENLAAESEALGNKQLDDTQRKWVLENIMAERATLTANRMELPPAPDVQDRLNGRIANAPDGTPMVENSKGDFVPLTPAQKQQQQQQSQRPMSAIEFYGQNEDKMQKDIDAELASLEKKATLGELPKGVNADFDTAWKNIQTKYDQRQKALGRVGEPTLAAQVQPQQNSLMTSRVLYTPGDGSLPTSEPTPTQAQAPQPTVATGGSPITLKDATASAKLLESLAPSLQSLKDQEAELTKKAASASLNKDRSSLSQLAVDHAKLRKQIESTESQIKQAEKTARGFYDQEVAKQPAVKKLAESGKRPQDYAQAEYQLNMLRQQYPDMSKMPEEAKKQLRELMSVINAGR